MIRMRSIMIWVTLLLVVSMVVFPELASSRMRLDAFGWQLETRQGFFVLLLLLLFWAVYLLQAGIRLLVLGHGRLLLGWRAGRLGRKERYLRRALLQWIDAEGDMGRRALEKSGDILPQWLQRAWSRVSCAVDELPLPSDAEEDALANAMVARLATDARHWAAQDAQALSLHLHAWQKASPGSLLARFRLARLALQEGQPERAAAILEDLLKKDVALSEALARSGEAEASCRPLLARAWLALAEQDEGQRGALLRRLRRLDIHDGALVLRLGELLRKKDGDRAVKKLWLDFLQHHDDVAVADACFALLADDAMGHFRQLEHVHGTPAFQWLKARLAHACGLDGLATEIMRPLLLADPRPAFLRSQAQWLQEQQRWREACETLERALESYCTFQDR